MICQATAECRVMVARWSSRKSIRVRQGAQQYRNNNTLAFCIGTYIRQRVRRILTCAYRREEP
eukprot:1421615-Pleurochrysis_carterae.AAC.1